ncbi:MAG: Smr/MutS family protein [Candidatus Binatia bacterium]
MSRRKEPGEDSTSFNTPFRRLRDLIGPLPIARAATNPVAVRARALNAPPSSKPPRAAREEDAGELFRSAVQGVIPIPLEERNHAAGRLPTPSPNASLRDDAEALAELSDLVAGITAFDVSDTDEHVEGMVIGLDPRIVRRLRAGEFASQAHFDLHGMTTDEAKTAVAEFVRRSWSAGLRCVLLIHGRGRNSPDQRPVLKDALKRWLTRGDLGKLVLAFATARACDGGSGAMYVLLRRERSGKRPFRTLEGAKS